MADAILSLTKDFTLQEMVRSEKAIELKISEQFNPSAEVILALRDLCINLLQPLRDHLGVIDIDSGWRCPRLNAAIGGVGNSWHVLGEAADCKHPVEDGFDNMAIIHAVLELKLPFDQMIDEKNLEWVHLSYSRKQCRRQVLKFTDGHYEIIS